MPSCRQGGRTAEKNGVSFSAARPPCRVCNAPDVNLPPAQGGRRVSGCSVRQRRDANPRRGGRTEGQTGGRPAVCPFVRTLRASCLVSAESVRLAEGMRAEGLTCELRDSDAPQHAFFVQRPVRDQERRKAAARAAVAAEDKWERRKKRPGEGKLSRAQSWSTYGRWTFGGLVQMTDSFKRRAFSDGGFVKTADLCRRRTRSDGGLLQM